MFGSSRLALGRRPSAIVGGGGDSAKSRRVSDEKGFAAARLEDVAARVGIRRPSIIYYFHNKRDNNEAVLDDVSGGLLERIRAAISTSAALPERIEAVVHAWVTYIGARPSLARILLREVAEASPARSPSVVRHVEPVIAAVEQVIREGQRAGIFASIDPMHFIVTVQKRRYLPPLAKGHDRFCFAITEPDAGSNSFRIQTLARRDGDHYILRGQKTFITGVDDAQHMLVVARTTPANQVADKREGMSLFIIDTKAFGLEAQRIDTRIVAPERQFQVFFDDVRIPCENRLGDEGKALTALFDALNPERIILGATAVGLGRFALGKVVEYAKTRKVFDVPIGAHQGLAHPMAMAKTHVELSALMTHHAAQVFDAGGEAGTYANMAKLAAAEAAIEAVYVAIQVHGGGGFTGEVDVITLWPLVRLMRTAPVSREMILNYIGEHVLGLPRSY